eukprot:TRINITY_DN26730_c0_g2_i1.p1 TRINITY_DN26730_c0_g2~~TRINITY_DN26730_c0_g2_i1.p1  ORF type:complete len:673 (+),score=157.70 TRINITY_DN26730_c0_g2_i1:73-2091(+)
MSLPDVRGAMEVYIGRIQGLEIQHPSDQLRVRCGIVVDDFEVWQETPWDPEPRELANRSFFAPCGPSDVPPQRGVADGRPSVVQAEMPVREADGSFTNDPPVEVSTPKSMLEVHFSQAAMLRKGSSVISIGTRRSSRRFTVAADSSTCRVLFEVQSRSTLGWRHDRPKANKQAQAHHAPSDPNVAPQTPARTPDPSPSGLRTVHSMIVPQPGASDPSVVTLYKGGKDISIHQLMRDTAPLQVSIPGSAVDARRLAGSPKRRSLTNIAPDIDFFTTVTYMKGLSQKTGVCAPRTTCVAERGPDALPLSDIYSIYCWEWGFKPNRKVISVLEGEGNGLPIRGGREPEEDDGRVPTSPGGGSPQRSFAEESNPYIAGCAVVESLDLRGTYLGDIGCLPLMATLRHFTTLRHADLRDNGIALQGMAALKEALQPHRHLHTLDLRGNKMYDMSGGVLKETLAVNRAAVEVLWDAENLSESVHNKIQLQVAANVLLAHRKSGMRYGLPLPETYTSALEGIWGQLVAPPYVDPPEAMVSARLERFMRHIDRSFAEYRNPGLAAVFRPRIDTLNAKKKIVATSDITLKTSFYSALLIGISALLPAAGPDAYPIVERDALSRLGALYRAFGVRDFHMTELIDASAPALEAAGIPLTPTGKLAWQSALAVICTSLMPSIYPL